MRAGERFNDQTSRSPITRRRALVQMASASVLILTAPYSRPAIEQARINVGDFIKKIQPIPSFAALDDNSSEGSDNCTAACGQPDKEPTDNSNDSLSCVACNSAPENPPK